MPITATFGTVEYRDSGVIGIPLTFDGADVIVPSKSICQITPVSNADLTGVNYRVIGKARAFEVVVEMPPDRKGSFSVDIITGTVLNASTSKWDTVTVAAKTVTYDTRIPRIIAYDIPENYTAGEKFDVKIDVGVVATGLHLNNVQDVFILEGAANLMGTPTPYKWIGKNTDNTPKKPNLQADVVDEVSIDKSMIGENWQRLAGPDANLPRTAENDFDETGEQWHGEAGQYFLIRWESVAEGTTGIFNMTLREGMLRGPDR